MLHVVLEIPQPVGTRDCGGRLDSLVLGVLARPKGFAQDNGLLLS